MLYWICPECGGECSPAIRECPVCAGTPEISPASAGPANGQTLVTEEVLSLSRNLQATAGTHTVANGLITDNGHSALTATLELPEMPAHEEPCAPFEEAMESL